MRYKSINPTLFVRNRKKIAEKIELKSVVILHSNDEMPRNGDQFFPYRQSSDFFYLTGIDQGKSILLLCPDHPDKKKREILFLLETNKTIEIWNGHKFTKLEAAETSGITNIQWLSNYDSILTELLMYANNVYCNLFENPKFKPDFETRDKRMFDKIKDTFPMHNFKRLAPLLTELRLVKEKEELELMQHACDITEKAFYRILKFMKPGVTEFQVEAEMTHEFIKNRANGHAYAPIVASGKNACVLHYIDNDKICKDSDLLLMDFGAEYANYAADCTRTIPVNGKFTKRQLECYNAVLNVLKQAKQLLKPGTTINEVNKKVNKLMEAEMIKLGLFTEDDVKKQDADKPMYFKYFMHGTSHFIGLDVHDVGLKDVVLKKNMVLTCEPGLYIAEENIGIRLENDIVVDDSPRDLMESVPIEPEDIEKLME